MRDFPLKICCLKKKNKVLEEAKNKLEEELNVVPNVYVVSLKGRLFSYDNFITDEKLLRETTGLEFEKFKILYGYLDPGENCEILNTMTCKK